MEPLKPKEATSLERAPIELQLTEPPRVTDLFRQLHVYKAAIAAILIFIVGAFFLVVPVLFKTSEGVSNAFTLLGTVFLPTGFISFVYEYMLRNSLLQLMRGQLEDALQVIPVLLNRTLEPKFNSLSKELWLMSKTSAMAVLHMTAWTSPLPTCLTMS